MRRRDVRVAELLLNNIDRCVLAREFPCMCMTKAVKMNPLLDARLSTEPTHECPHVALEKGLALERADDRLPTIEAEFSPPI